jgi:hypothetical protein
MTLAWQFQEAHLWHPDLKTVVCHHHRKDLVLTFCEYERIIR